VPSKHCQVMQAFLSNKVKYLWTRTLDKNQDKLECEYDVVKT
jgi:hypothetical protein